MGRSPGEVQAFVPELMAPDRPFRPGLRVKGGAHPRVFEMTWDNDGRARFTYGPERVPGQPHVTWRRPATGRLRPTSEGGEASGKPEPVTGPREHLPRANAPAVGAAWSARRLSGCRRLPAARARDRGR